MSLPENAAVVRVRGYYYDQDGTGSGLKVTAIPSETLLIDQTAHAYIHLEPKEVTPNEGDSYWYLDLIASNDPDLTPAFTWTISIEGGPTYSGFTVPHDAPLEDVGEAADMRAIWLTAATA